MNRNRFWLTGKTIRGMGLGGTMSEYPLPATKNTMWNAISGAHHELFDLDPGPSTRSWASPLNENSFLFSNGQKIWAVRPTGTEDSKP